MRVVRTESELRAALSELQGSRALVMTMGSLHEGHLALVKKAKELSDHTVASIYVNPLQFGPGEDFDAYPRDLDADLALLEPLGVDLVYAPDDEEMYPREPLVRVDPGPVADILEGATRPGHFAGVLQVVCKVMNLTRPDYAMFGQKDAQQLALVTTMVKDLSMGIEVVPVPIEREASRLARSSRNVYLSQAEREEALTLSRALEAGRQAGIAWSRGTEGTGTPTREAAGTGRTAAAVGAPAAVLAAARSVVDSSPGVKLDYLVLVDPDTFIEVAPEAEGGLLAIAAWVGTTRLIDNMHVQWKG